MEVSRGIAQSAQSAWFGTLFREGPEVRILVPRPPFTSYGKLAERLIAPDLKSVMSFGARGFESFIFRQFFIGRLPERTIGTAS